MTDRIQKALRKISEKERRAVEQLISRILRGDFLHLDIKKLQGSDDVYRVRKGNLRIIFQKKETRRPCSCCRASGEYDVY